MTGLLGRRLLVVGAHPDDEVLGCGGLIAANAAVGGESHVLIVSEGSSAQNGNNPNLMKRRHAQLERAVSHLGATALDHWDYPDMQLDTVPHTELNKALQKYIEGGEFSVVLTHHPFDINRDHQVLFRSVLVACRPTPESPVDALLTYHINSSTEWAMGPPNERFAPSLYVDITAQLDRKLEALSFYEEELREYPHPRSIEAVRDRARVYGSEVGLEAAEGFHLVYARERSGFN